MNDLKNLEYFKKYKSVTTNLDTADADSITFYRVKSEKDLPQFEKRLSKSKCELVFVTAHRDLSYQNVQLLTADEFVIKQKELVELFYPILPKTKICGITGTNGKTTVVHLCNSLAAIFDKKTLSIGTLGVIDQNGRTIEEINTTTPSYIDLRRIVSTYQHQYDAFFLEVSSHGLEQGRISGIEFSAAAWVSFSQDHLDYHKTMDEYFSSKQKILNYLRKNVEVFVPSLEIELFKRLSKEKQVVIAERLEVYGLSNLKGIFNVSYNRNNLEIALSIVNKLWKINKNINCKTLSLPPGRFSLLEKDNCKVVIDYAHTPNALENICHAVKSEYPDSFLITVFGCGGDRDPKKRPLMGAAAELHSDLLIITSDNPRSEEPIEIINQILKGISEDKNKIIEVDRALAITIALEYKSESNCDYLIIIAGKGHEAYQEIKGVKMPFSDFAIVEKKWNI
ncbi:MAG: hypothetical protein HN576_17420 [Bacteriovoracaceae bacterium]|jgi:UDP-N-acetylmuramoyl-L-alanyl-D-glutamate--2,6-diaminopimelate ligase|nr:hypothetical protein [Bacteriovoracaceae bacterium]